MSGGAQIKLGNCPVARLLYRLTPQKTRTEYSRDGFGRASSIEQSNDISKTVTIRTGPVQTDVEYWTGFASLSSNRVRPQSESSLCTVIDLNCDGHLSLTSAEVIHLLLIGQILSRLNHDPPYNSHKYLFEMNFLEGLDPIIRSVSPQKRFTYGTCLLKISKRPLHQKNLFG